MDESLGRLRAAIDGLPASIRTGRRDGPLVKYLTPALSKDDEPQPVFPSHTDGPYCAFNQEWERAFQKKPGEPPEILHSLVYLSTCAVTPINTRRHASISERSEGRGAGRGGKGGTCPCLSAAINARPRIQPKGAWGGTPLYYAQQTPGPYTYTPLPPPAHHSGTPSARAPTPVIDRALADVDRPPRTSSASSPLTPPLPDQTTPLPTSPVHQTLPLAVSRLVRRRANHR
ncbi:hypothetical protein B0H17DRAFT_1208162 [Mycena rosella]|uniref:Uncharacterized protein n=1 Tax=Mycena rosella TaxID=1033263 RepID=A0AAD7D1X1_MYCRO|nr:hypothetical protein B0H17DRAFT_1208162 [Mycena rosella]